MNQTEKRQVETELVSAAARVEKVRRELFECLPALSDIFPGGIDNRPANWIVLLDKAAGNIENGFDIVVND